MRKKVNKRTQNTKLITHNLRIALVCPHMFMQDVFLDTVIFSPGHLAITLANGLVDVGHEVTLFSPGPVTTNAKNETVSLEMLNEELRMRHYDVHTLMQKHPLLFSTLSRQLQTELLTKAFKMANEDQFDVVHVYMNEEELGLAMSDLCSKPVVFTHHEPMNFLARYRSIFPKYQHKNWISISYAQRESMPADTNWVGNVYHGYTSPLSRQSRDIPSPSMMERVVEDRVRYVAYFGRIIEPKGVHLAIQAVKKYNNLKTHNSKPLTLKIAGKHYADSEKKSYWHTQIEPHIDGKEIQYVGFISDEQEKQMFLATAEALLMPSIWNEPFGMVMIESMAVGTPIIGLDSGAIPEVVEDERTGYIIKKFYKKVTDDRSPTRRNSVNGERLTLDEDAIVEQLSTAIPNISQINRETCRVEFEKRFTVERMVKDYIKIYEHILR